MFAGDVCSYAVFSSLQNFPFKVVQDHKADAVKIILGERFQLDYEKTKEYDFEIETHACSQSINYERSDVKCVLINRCWQSVDCGLLQTLI